MAPQVQSVGSFIAQVITEVANKLVANLVQFTSEKVSRSASTSRPVAAARVAPQLWANLDSVSLWQLMEVAADRPWNELFIRDEETGPLGGVPPGALATTMPMTA